MTNSIAGRSGVRLENERQLLGALADPVRIRMLAALAEDGLTTPELAAALGMPVNEIGRHLAVLGKAGLVTTQQGGRMRLAVERLATAQEALAAMGEPARTDASVPVGIRQFFRDGRLASMPAKRSRQLEVLAFLIEDFEFGQEYPEVEVNAIIARRYGDYATVRRDFIDEGMMTRERGIYRRVDGDRLPGER